MSKRTLATTFVHGYENLDINLPEQQRPALWVLEEDGSSEVYSYPFPRNPEDFQVHEDLISGEMPLPSAESFKKLPRFGLTGLDQNDTHLFAGSWNSIYKISKKDYSLEKILTNRYMSDLHGIYADNECVISVLTCRDTVVISDLDGNYQDHFSVDNKLQVTKPENVKDVDWRFVSKQFRGSTGYWHFNYVQKFGNEIWLTARNASCFVVVDLNTMTAELRLMNLCTTALLHDGVKIGNKFYFTSIDGKIMIAEEHQTTDKWTRESKENLHLYNRDLVVEDIRIKETEFGREPNWCRGITSDGTNMFVTVDGRYDTDLSFGVLGIREEDKKIMFNERLKWSQIGDESEIRYVTGFDIKIVS